MSLFGSSNDLLHHICSNLGTSITSLGKLCSVNKFIRSYLYSEQARIHWIRTGQQICGKSYWPDNLDPFFPDGSDKYKARYIAMLMLCPWRSMPYNISVEPLRGATAFHQSFNVAWMNVISHPCRACVIAVDIHNSRYLISAAAEQPRVNEGQEEWDSCKQSDNSDDEEMYDELNQPPRIASHEEEEILRQLRDQAWRPIALYPVSILKRVFIVHDSLICVLCYGPGCDSTSAYFVSYRTLQVRHMLKGNFRSGIVIKPASIWILEGGPYTVRCMVPREDRSTVGSGFGYKEIELWEIYRAACRGDMDFVFSTMEAKGCDEEKLILAVIRNGPLASLTALLDKYRRGPATLYLECAVYAGRIDAVRMLIEYDADSSPFFSHLLYAALKCKKPTLKMVQLLLASGASVKVADGLRSLRKFIRENTPRDVYDLLVKEGMK